jgi:hypothetical protein
VTVASGRHRFAAQIVNVLDNVVGLDFTEQ